MLCRIARIPSSHATKKIYGVVTSTASICPDQLAQLACWFWSQLWDLWVTSLLPGNTPRRTKGESCCDPSKPLRYPILPAIFCCLQESSSCCLFVLLGSLKHHKIVSVAYMGLSTGPEWTPTWQFYTAEQRFFKTCRLCGTQLKKTDPKRHQKMGWLSG